MGPHTRPTNLEKHKLTDKTQTNQHQHEESDTNTKNIIYIYIYIAVNPKRYTGIDRYPKYIVSLAKSIQSSVRY